MYKMACMALLVAVPFCCAAGVQEARKVRAGAPVLFLDDEWVAARENITRTFHQPVKCAGNPVVRPDKAWENGVLLFGTALRDPAGGLFRMWYWSHGKPTDVVYSYATSEDGMHWEKPALDVVPIKGLEGTNIIYCNRGREGEIEEVRHLGLSGVVHTPDGYVMAYATRINRYPKGQKLQTLRPYRIAISPDGIHWKPSHVVWVEQPVYGDRACFTYDPRNKEYRLYARCTVRPGNLDKAYWGRGVALLRSKDLEHWSEPVAVMRAGPPDPKPTQIYSLMAWPTGNQWLGIVQNYRSDPQHLTVGLELAWSRDGVRWSRRHQPFIPLGEVGSWDRFNIAAGTVPVTAGDKTYIYYSGRMNRHGKHKDTGPWQPAIGLAIMRRDGYCSLDASFDGGVVETVPLLLPGGALYLNAKADYGTIAVEALDPSKRSVRGSDLAGRKMLVLEGGTYEQVMDLTADWLFATDPEDRGTDEGWFRPGFDRKDWMKVSAGRSWQGFKKGYYGSAWYARELLVPAGMKGRALELLFEGVDEDAWVYLNGELVFSRVSRPMGKLWDRPFRVAVSDALRYGKENLLVVRVHKAKFQTGIYKPVRMVEKEPLLAGPVELRGNGVRLSVNFPEDVDISVRPVSLRFRLKNARLYSFFVE